MFALYLEHHREGQMTKPTNDYFWAKQAQVNIFKQAMWVQVSSSSSQSKEERNIAGMWWQSWIEAQSLRIDLVLRHCCQGEAEWHFVLDERKEKEKRERKNCETPISLLPLLPYLSQQRSPVSQDLVALCHSVTMPKDFKLWGRVQCIDLYEEPC